MAKYHHNINGVKVDFTAEEEAARDAEIKAWEDGKLARKQAEMRELRDEGIETQVIPWVEDKNN